MIDEPGQHERRGLSEPIPRPRYGYPSTTAVVDRSVTDLDAVKNALGIPLTDATLDDRIDDLLEEAKVEADEYLGNPFLERDAKTGCYVDPHVEKAIPRKVERGVIYYVALGLWDETKFREAALAILRGDTDAVAPGDRVVSVKTGDLSETYALAGGGLTPGSKGASDALEALQARYWSSYRYEPV